MGREIYDIINDMAEVLNASQMQKLQEVLVKRLSENTVSDYLQTTNMDFLDMFLTAKHLEGCSDKTIRYYRCNIEKMLDTINIPVYLCYLRHCVVNSLQQSGKKWHLS